MTGAPEAYSNYQPGLETPGAVYACSVQNFRTGEPLNCAQAPIDNLGMISYHLINKNLYRAKHKSSSHSEYSLLTIYV